MVPSLMESAKNGKLMVLPGLWISVTCKEEDILLDEHGVVVGNLLEEGRFAEVEGFSSELRKGDHCRFSNEFLIYFNYFYGLHSSIFISYIRLSDSES